MRDPHSFSRPDEVAVRHLALDLDVDFAKKQLSGSARLDLTVRGGAREVVLDAKDLTIESVTLDDGSSARYAMGAAVKYMGQSLTIPINPATKSVTIRYATSPDAAAVQWLDPQQTAGGAHPFLFTQSQAILARTWVPCQDSPGVRMTYEVTVRVPRGLIAVMSAENPTELNETG